MQPPHQIKDRGCSLEHDQADPEDEEIFPFWRGIYVSNADREILFTMEVDIDPTRLPAWEPYITIDPRWFDDDDESFIQR